MEKVLLKHEGSVATVTLNNPDKLNALDDDIWDGLRCVLPKVAASKDVRCIVLTGAGRAFCAGGSIESMLGIDPIAARKLLTDQEPIVRALALSEKPVIAAVNGLAVGAGLSLALLSDVVIASSKARFRSAFTGIGAVPDLGLPWLLPRTIGFMRAKRLVLENPILSASEALEMGLASEVVPEAEFAERVAHVSQQYAKGVVSAMGLAKLLMNRAGHMDFQSYLELEALTQAQAFSHPESQEQIAEFLKRS